MPIGRVWPGHHAIIVTALRLDRGGGARDIDDEPPPPDELEPPSRLRSVRYNEADDEGAARYREAVEVGLWPL